MLVRELFLEGAMALRHGGMVNLIRNPSDQALLGLLGRARNRTMRGLIVGNEVMWWDAYDATHGDIADVYDPDYQEIENMFKYKKHRLALKLEGDQPHLYAGQTAEALAQIPSLARLVAHNFPMTVTMRGFVF